MKASHSPGKISCLSAVAILAAFLFANVLAVMPQLHERIDGDSVNHECVVTLIATGKYEQGDAPPLIFAPQPATQFSKLPALNPDLGASAISRCVHLRARAARSLLNAQPPLVLARSG